MATDLLLQPGEDPKDLDIISTIKEWEEGPTNVFQIESPHAPRLYNVDFDAFDKYMTRPWDLEGQDIYDMRAKGQSGGEKFRYGITKLAGKTATAVVGGVGMLAHGLPNMIYNLGAEAIDPEGTEGGYGDAFRSIFENDFQRGLDGINEWMDEKLPHYYSKEEQEMGVWQSMGTANFWLNDFVNGLSFVAGAVLTEIATGGLITAAMPVRATQFLNGISRANQIKRAAEATGVVSKFSKAGTMQNIVNATTVGRRLVTGAGYESGVEARHHYDQTMDALLEAWKDSPEGQARIKELGPRAQPTQEEMGKMHNLATQSTNGVFVGNLALVGAGNLIAFPRIFGAGYNMNRQSIGRVIKNASDDVAQRYSAAYKSFTKGEEIASGAYSLLKVPLYEGWVEEGGQAWMDIGGRKSSLDFYSANKNPNNMEAIGGMIEGMYDTFAETYGDKHVRKEIALGMILGAIGLPSFVRTNKKTGKKELKFENFHMSGGSWGQFQNRAEKREGADALAKWMNENPSAVKAMKNNFDALARSADASGKMDYALMTNNIYDWKNAKHDHFFSYVYSRAKAGFFEDVLEDINDIKAMDINSFGKMFYPGETELSEEDLRKRRDKVIESATKAATNIKDGYELVKRNGSRFSEDIQLMLAHSSSVAKDLDKRTENIRNLLGEFGVDLSALEKEGELENVIKEAYKTTAESLGKTSQIEALVRDYAEEGSDILTSYSKAFEKLGLEKPDESKLHEGEKVTEAEFSEASLRAQIVRAATEINKLQKELKTLQEKNEGENFSQENLDKINDLTARLNNLNTTYLRAKNMLQEGVESQLTSQDVQVLNAFEKENPMVFAERKEEIIQALIDLRKLRARRHGFINLYNQLFTPDGQQEALQQVEDIIVSRDKLATEAGIEDEKLKGLFNEYGGGEIFEFDYTNNKGETSKKRAVFINPKQILVLPGSVAGAYLSKEKYYSRLKQLEGKTDKKSLEETAKIKQILEKYFLDGQISESVWNLDETDPNKITNIKGVSKEEYRLELLKRAIRNLKAGSNLNLEQVALDISEIESEIDEELTKLLTLDKAGVKGTITLEKLKELQDKIWDTINTLESSKNKLLEQKILIQKDVAQLDEILKYYKDPELTPQAKYDKILGISVLSEITEEAKKIYEEYGMESDPVYGELFGRINVSELAAAIEQSDLEVAPSSEYLEEIDNAIDQYTRAIEDVQRTRAYIEKILRDHAERQGVVGAKEAPIEWLVELISKEDSDFFKTEFELLANEENELRELLEKKQNEVNLKTRALELATQVKNLARLQDGLANELNLVMAFMDRFFIPPPEIVNEIDKDNPPTQNAQMDENENYEFFKRYAPSLLEGTGFFKTIGAHQELLGRYEEMMGRSAEEKATPEFKRELERILPELSFFKFAEETKTFKEYKLRIISIKDRNEFLTKEGEPRVHFFSEDETREEAHLIYLLVDAYTGKPIEDKDNKGLIYASVMDPSAWRPNGDYRFATSDFADIENPTQEELDAVAAKEEEYKQWRQEILDKKTPTYVSIDDKNNAIRKWENNDYYSRNSIVGRLIKDTNKLKDAPIKVVVAPKGEERGKISLFGDKRTFVGKNGMPYIERNGQLIPLFPATLNNTPDILDIVYNALVQYGINEKAFQFDEISSNKDVNKIEGTEKNLDQILSDYIMFGAIGINRKLSKYAIYWEKGVLKFGETGTINYTELSDPTKYEDKHKELKEFLKTLNVQINKGGETHNFLNKDINARATAKTASTAKGKTVAPSYTKFIQTIIDEEGNVTTKTWKNYTEFLVSERNGNLPILTTNIVEDVNYVKKLAPNQRITTPQFISTYFKIDPKFGGLNIKKSPKPKIVDHMQAGRGGLELDSIYEGEFYRVWGTSRNGERGYVEVPVIVKEVNRIEMLQFDLTSAVIQEDLESPQQTINRLMVINAHIADTKGNILPSSLATLNTALEVGTYKHNFNIVISKLGTEDPMEKVEGSTGINAIIEAADKGKSIPGFESVQKGEEDVEKEEAPAGPVAPAPENLDNIENEEEDDVFMSTDYSNIPKENYQVWDPIAETAWYNAVMPKDEKGNFLIPFEIMRDLIDGHAFGKLTKAGNILLYKEAIEGALYHEAYHGVTRLLMTTEDRLELYDQLRGMRGKDYTYRGTFKKLSEFTDKEVDEYLAEEFRKFRLSGGTYKIGKGRKLTWLDRFMRWLDKVLNFFTGSDDRISSLFNKINNGGFKNASIINKNRSEGVYLTPDDTAFERHVYRGMTSYLAKVAIKDRKMSFYDFYESNFKEDTEDLLAGIYGKPEDIINEMKGVATASPSVLKSLARRFSSMKAAAKSPNEKAKIEINYKNILDNWDKYITGHLEYIRHFKLEVNPDSITEENDKNKLDIIEKDEKDPNTYMSNPLRFLIGSSPMLNKDGTRAFNELGLPEPVDFNDVVGYLYRALANSTSLSDMTNKLKDSIAFKPELAVIYNRLKLSESIIDPLSKESNHDWGDVRMKLAFYNQFNQANDDYLLYIQKDNGGDKYFINANTNRVEEVTRREWQSNLEGKLNDENSPFKIADNGNIVIDVETPLSYKPSKVVGEKLTFGKPKSIKDWTVFKRTFEDNLGILSSLGIEFSNSSNINPSIINTATDWILYELLDKKDVTTIFSRDQLDVGGRINELLSEELRSSSLGLDLSFQNSEGKTVFGVSRKTYLNVLVDKFNSMSLEDIELLLENSANLRGSSWIQRLKEGEKLKVVNIQGTRLDVIGRRGRHLSKGTKSDIAVVHLQAILDGYPPYLRAADQKSEYGIGFGDKTEIVPIDYARSVLTKHLEDEIRTAQLLRAEGIGSDIAGYKENAETLRYFEGIVTIPDHVLAQVMSDDQISEFVIGEQIQKEIVFHLENNIQDLKNYLYEYELVTKSNQNVGLSNTQLHNLAGALQLKYDGKNVNNDLIDAYSQQAALKHIIGTIEMSKLVLGDLAMFSKTSIFKRTKLASGAKIYPATGSEVNDWFNTNMPRSYGEHSDELVSVVRGDIMTSAEFVEEYIKVITETFGTQAGEEAREVYENLNEFDGGGFIHLDADRSLSLKLEEWSPKQEEAFQEIERGWRLNEETMAYFPDMKPQYFGTFRTSKISVPTGYKFALFPIHENMFNPKSSLYQIAINMREQKVDMQVFESVSKVGGVLQQDGEFMPMYRDVQLGKDAVSVYNPIDNTTNKQILETGLMGLQVKNSPKLDLTTTVGTQQRTQMKNNLYEEGELDPVFADLKDDLQLMDDAYEAITEKGMNILLAKTGIVKENGVYSFKNNDAAILENFLIEEMNNRDMSRHLKNSISHLLQTDTRFTDLLMSKPKIEKLLFSLATNSTIKQKTSGSMLVQRASTGFEVGAKAIKQRDFELNNKLEGVDMKPLRFYKRGSSGKTNAMQVLAPVHWKEYIGANVDINEGIIDKELFNLIGFRIPTEGLASIDFIEVVGFLPEGYTSVVVPTELVGKAGSDYDIDKLTLYFPNYEINKKTGYLHKVKFLTGTSDTDALRRLIKIRETEPDTYLSLVSEYLPEYRKYFEDFKRQAKELRVAIKTLKNNSITKDIIKEIQDLELEISIQSEWGRNKKRVKLLNNRLREANLKFVSIVSDIEAPWINLSEFQQITGSLEVIRRELSKYDNVLLDVFKTMPITMQNTKKALQNVILDTHWKILSHPANYSSLINPIGSPTFKSLRDSIVAKKSTSYTSRLAALTSKSNSSTLSTMEAKEMLSLSKRLNEMNENKLWSDVLSFRNVVDKSYNMWSGLGGVGAVAINSVDNPRAQQIGMKINSEYLRNNPEAALWFEGFSPYEFSLSKRKNSGGRVLISSSLSELGQGYVDVTADDWVFMINAGLNFSMVWTLYLRAGVPIDLLGYFMNQPIVDEFVRQKNIKQGTHRDTFEGASIGYQSDSYIMKGIKKNIKGAAKLPLVQLSKAELYNMIGNTLEGMNSREKAIQLQVLSMLEAAMSLGREAGGFHKVTAYDTNAPSDRASIRYMRVAKEVLQSKNIFVDNKEEDAVEATLSLPVLSGFKNATAEFPEIFKNLFVADTIVEYNAKADEIVRQGIENNLFEDDIIYTLNRFENHIIIHTLQNSKLGTDKQLKQRANSLMQGLSSLPNRIANMKRGSTNLLIKELHPILQPYTNPKHPEYGVSNLQLRRKKLAPADLELLGDSYLELYNNPEFKDLALDILFFSLLQSGNNFSRISIFHSIPDWVLIDLAKDAIGQIANSRVNFREIVPSFYANSHRNGLISPYFNSRDLSSFKGLVESEDGKLMLSSNRGGFNSGRLAIPAWHRASRNNSITISIPAISQAKIKEYQKIDKRIPMITKLFGKKDSINVGEQKLFVYEEINKQGNGIYHVEIGDTTIHNKNKVIDAQKIGNSVIPMGLRSVKRSIASGNITKLVLFNELKTQAGNEGVIETADGAILKVRKLGTYTKGQLSKDKVKSSLGITSLDDLLKQAGLISYPYFGKVFKNTTFVKTKNKGPVHIYEVEILNSGYYTDEEVVYNQGKEFDSSGFKKIEKDEQSSAEIAAAQLNAAEKKLEDACKGKKS